MQNFPIQGQLESLLVVTQKLVHSVPKFVAALLLIKCLPVHPTASIAVHMPIYRLRHMLAEKLDNIEQVIFSVRKCLLINRPEILLTYREQHCKWNILYLPWNPVSVDAMKTKRLYEVAIVYQLSINTYE